VCFPSDATNKLWQLISHKVALWPAGCTALACLFATLNDENGDAGTVLTLLDIKMSTFGTGTGNAGKGPMPARQLQRMRELTMRACLTVFAFDGFRTGRPAVFEYLDRHAGTPQRLAVIARIWAGVIVYRPLRWEAFRELRRGLHALRDISEDPTDVARAFGAALAEALPPGERRQFKDDFMWVDERMRQGQKEPPAEVLLACLDAISPKTHRGGAR
jgi:hypothetical protein